jgi:hypothetical protein
MGGLLHCYWLGWLWVLLTWPHNDGINLACNMQIQRSLVESLSITKNYEPGENNSDIWSIFLHWSSLYIQSVIIWGGTRKQNLYQTSIQFPQVRKIIKKFRENTICSLIPTGNMPCRGRQLSMFQGIIGNLQRVRAGDRSPKGSNTFEYITTLVFSPCWSIKFVGAHSAPKSFPVMYFVHISRHTFKNRRGALKFRINRIHDITDKIVISSVTSGNLYLIAVQSAGGTHLKFRKLNSFPFR